MRSASSMTARIRCSTKTMLAPCARISRTSAMAPSISLGVRPESTSSSSSSCGRAASAPIAQHDDAFGELHDRAHQMLDEDDARALRADLAHERDGAVDLARRKAGEHLVEQQQLRPRGE